MAAILFLTRFNRGRGWFGSGYLDVFHPKNHATDIILQKRTRDGIVCYELVPSKARLNIWEGEGAKKPTWYDFL